MKKFKIQAEPTILKDIYDLLKIYADQLYIDSNKKLMGVITPKLEEYGQISIFFNVSNGNNINSPLFKIGIRSADENKELLFVKYLGKEDVSFGKSSFVFFEDLEGAIDDLIENEETLEFLNYLILIDSKEKGLTKILAE